MKINTETGVGSFVLLGIFYVSTDLLTVANNILLPVLFIDTVHFFAKNIELRIILFIVAIFYTNIKYFIFLKLIPNFIQINIMSTLDPSQCLVVNPIDLSLLLVSLIFITVKLQCCKTAPLTFEESVTIFVLICLSTIKIAGIVYDMVYIGVFTRHMESHIQFTGLNTELMPWIKRRRTNNTAINTSGGTVGNANNDVENEAKTANPVNPEV
ncbi:hypothetical protein CAEBREN_19631 [Caenorhabditis brenneri]|uniref:Uncharacterized protein n=1 Tax=Caenorhabditis brenneri TaxID=135651 RepID=G0NHS2_CAEBE|nr:hypothetical protein CAEBREN_19631 [Caenorhabditis brenneri]